MEASELRIGNLVNTGSFHLQKFKGNYQVNEGWFKYAHKFDPILLTEEWLFNLGFVKNLNNYELENFRFHISKPMNYDGFLFCESYSVLTDNIKHVHQLQNLYFALTGEELIYKNTDTIKKSNKK